MSFSHNQTRSILLSGEEILGLVVDDNDSDHDEGLLADSDHPFLSSYIRSCPTPWTDTTSSAAADFPPPPQQRRAVTWSSPETNNAHSIQSPDVASTIEPSTSSDFDYSARDNNSCSESSDEEVSLDGSMTTNTPNSPVGPRRPSVVYQHQPSRDNNRYGTKQPFRGMETTDHQALRLLRTTTASATESFYPRLAFIEAFIEPFDETANDTIITVDHVKEIHAPKRPSSRFEIFENKMREEEETFGFLL